MRSGSYPLLTDCSVAKRPPSWRSYSHPITPEVLLPALAILILVVFLLLRFGSF